MAVGKAAVWRYRRKIAVRNKTLFIALQASEKVNLH